MIKNALLHFYHQDLAAPYFFGEQTSECEVDCSNA